LGGIPEIIKSKGFNLVSCSAVMRELVLATISDQPDIEIVGQIHGDTEIASAVEQTRPDFLIITLDNSTNCRILAASFSSIIRISN
jgi:hypothetical protein